MPAHAVAEGTEQLWPGAIGRPIPFNILAFIRTRAEAKFEPVVVELAGRLMTIPDLDLRPQNSKKEPWYFQVRCPRFRQVLAYVNVSGTSARIDYRLPKDHDTQGRGLARDNFYGITFGLTDITELDFAMRLMMDALAQPVDLGASPSSGDIHGDPAPPELIARAYRESPPSMKLFLDYLADRADSSIPNNEIAEGIGVSRPQLAGVLGAFGRRWANRYQKRHDKWFFDAEWMADTTGDWKWHYRIPARAAQVIANARSEGDEFANDR